MGSEMCIRDRNPRLAAVMNQALANLINGKRGRQRAARAAPEVKDRYARFQEMYDEFASLHRCVFTGDDDLILRRFIEALHQTPRVYGEVIEIMRQRATFICDTFSGRVGKRGIPPTIN